MGNDDHLRVAATINNMANFEQFKDNLNATWAAIDELEDRARTRKNNGLSAETWLFRRGGRQYENDRARL